MTTNGSNKHSPIQPSTEQDEFTEKLRSVSSVNISSELFEKLYLSPQTKVKGDLRKTFANPTPLALAGFLLSLTPLSCTLMGWRGAGGGGAAVVGSFFFEGGMMMVLSGLLEWFLGNTLSFVVFCSFGGFYLSFGATLVPYFNATLAYASDPTSPTAAADAAASSGYNATFGFYLVSMLLLCLVYLICSAKTNFVFFMIFFTITLAFGFLTGAYWQIANGNMGLAARLTKGGGACAFATAVLGWYLFLAQMLGVMQFPFTLPVGDLGWLWVRIEGNAGKVDGSNV